MKPQRLRLVVLSAGLAVGLFLAFERTFLPGIVEKPFYKGFELLGSVVRLVKNDYIEERDPAKTMEGAFKGVIDYLDPLSSYFNREMTAKYLQRHARWADIGAVLFKSDFGLFPQVVGIIENSPAEKAGLKPGDYISALDGSGTLNMSLLDINLYLKDLEQKPVTIKILRENAASEIQIFREVLYSESYNFKTAGRFAVLKLNNLFPPGVDAIKKSVLPFFKPSKKLLILDLRNCCEGDIDETRNFLNIFLESPSAGHFVKKGGVQEVFALSGKPSLETLPVAVWINQSTMGPGELVAGVLQETQKVKVLGAATPGLVSRQELFPLQDGSSVLLTSSVFTLASGKKLWGEGVMPDEKIDLQDQTSDSYMKKTEALFPGR